MNHNISSTTPRSLPTADGYAANNIRSDGTTTNVATPIEISLRNISDDKDDRAKNDMTLNATAASIAPTQRNGFQRALLSGFKGIRTLFTAPHTHSAAVASQNKRLIRNNVNSYLGAFNSELNKIPGSPRTATELTQRLKEALAADPMYQGRLDEAQVRSKLDELVLKPITPRSSIDWTGQSFRSEIDQCLNRIFQAQAKVDKLSKQPTSTAIRASKYALGDFIDREKTALGDVLRYGTMSLEKSVEFDRKDVIDRIELEMGRADAFTAGILRTTDSNPALRYWNASLQSATGLQRHFDVCFGTVGSSGNNLPRTEKNGAQWSVDNADALRSAAIRIIEEDWPTLLKQECVELFKAADKIAEEAGQSKNLPPETIDAHKSMTRNQIMKAIFLRMICPALANYAVEVSKSNNTELSEKLKTANQFIIKTVNRLGSNDTSPLTGYTDAQSKLINKRLPQIEEALLNKVGDLVALAYPDRGGLLMHRDG